MMEMNTTPLIDVMLVLLVMLIITIPVQTHAVKLDLPGGPPPERVDPIKNRLAITLTGALLWNGKVVSKPDLRVLLEATAASRREPELHLPPSAEAPYGSVDEVLAMAKRAEVTRMGFVGNEAYARF
jgi:biopolymer transport protein ExbD